MKRLLCLVIAFMMITSISVTAIADVYAEANGSEKVRLTQYTCHGG